MEDIALMALPSNAEEDSEIGSISTNHTSNEDNDTSKDVHFDEEYIIKCICGFQDDDGNTVYCERCDTWQHTVCYYFDENGVAPSKEILGSIDHFCADCKPRPLDTRAAIKRQVNRKADISSNTLWMQRNEQQSNAPPEKQTATIMSPYDTSEGLIRKSPQVERAFVNAQASPSPDHLPPPDMPPTPGRMRRSELRERTRRPKAQPSQGDAVLIGFMGGLKHADLASKAGEYPLSQESEEPTGEDELESESDYDSNQSLTTAMPGFGRGLPPKDHQYGPSSNEITEAPHLETLNPVDPIVKRGDLQVACDNCRRLKRRVSILVGNEGHYSD